MRLARERILQDLALPERSKVSHRIKLPSGRPPQLEAQPLVPVKILGHGDATEWVEAEG